MHLNLETAVGEGKVMQDFDSESKDSVNLPSPTAVSRLKSKVKSTLLISGCIIASVGIARFCHHATQGFRLSKVQSNFIPNQPIAAASEKDKEFLSALFQQKFHFIGRGLQSFVFESEDAKYVLKLFNNRYQRKIQLFSFLSHFPFLGQWALPQAHYFQGKLLKTFKSYQIAFDEMQDKTGLLYIHLCPTSNLPNQVTLIDPLRIFHEIDPNKIGFLIQKKAALVYPALKEYLKQRDIEGAKYALSSLLKLFLWKWHHAIADNDSLIRTNYGFINGEAIQIDVGPLSKQTVLQDMEQGRQEIERITASLKFWLNENAPELTAFLDQELHRQLSSEG